MAIPSLLARGTLVREKTFLTALIKRSLSPPTKAQACMISLQKLSDWKEGVLTMDSLNPEAAPNIAFVLSSPKAPPPNHSSNALAGLNPRDITEAASIGSTCS